VKVAEKDRLAGIIEANECSGKMTLPKVREDTLEDTQGIVG
jgi:hypothetical protein